jgi:hypothetical protein
MRRWSWFLTGVGVFCLACLLVACSKETRVDARAQRAARLQAAYDVVAAVTSASEAGITYEEYSVQVPKASAALLTYQAEDDAARDVAGHLSAAVYAYQTALRAWATKYDECQDCAWRKFVNVHPQFAEEADADYAIHVLWNTAKTEMTAAQEGIAAYKAD